MIAITNKETHAINLELMQEVQTLKAKVTYLQTLLAIKDKFSKLQPKYEVQHSINIKENKVNIEQKIQPCKEVNTKMSQDSIKNKLNEQSLYKEQKRQDQSNESKEQEQTYIGQSYIEEKQNQNSIIYQNNKIISSLVTTQDTQKQFSNKQKIIKKFQQQQQNIINCQLTLQQKQNKIDVLNNQIQILQTQNLQLNNMIIKLNTDLQNIKAQLHNSKAAFDKIPSQIKEYAQLKDIILKNSAQLLQTIRCYYSSNYFHVGPRYHMLNFCIDLINKVKSQQQQKPKAESQQQLY